LILTFSDVWAFGIVLLEMVTRSRAYSDILDDNMVMTRVGSRIAPKIPSNGPQVLLELMQACWPLDAKERVNMKGVNVALADGMEALA
jgi:hypothetical protein